MGKRIGNTTLVNYGIQNELSDYRIHVGFKSRHIYVYPTSSGKAAIEKRVGSIKKVSMDGIITTAKGYAVPIQAIRNIQEIVIPLEIYRRHKISPLMSTTEKGNIAVAIVIEMFKSGLIPLPMNTNIVNDYDMQISGTDLIIKSKLRIQIKCDYKAGSKKHGGTGNLFLQTAECNPYKMT